MRGYKLGLLMLLALALIAQPSSAKTGYVHVTFAKGGLIAGAGAGRGVLTFDGRKYPFTVYGLSLGATVGASISRLVGRASYLHQLSDFEGTYTAVGAGRALVAGGGAQERQGCDHLAARPEGGSGVCLELEWNKNRVGAAAHAVISLIIAP